MSLHNKQVERDELDNELREYLNLKKTNNMEAITISFTTVGQDANKIKKAIADLAKKHNNVILIHTRAPLGIAKKKASIETMEHLLESFPSQLTMYRGTALRKEMADMALKLNATSYVIGDIKEGVADEVEALKAKGRNIHVIELN